MLLGEVLTGVFSVGMRLIEEASSGSAKTSVLGGPSRIGEFNGAGEARGIMGTKSSSIKGELRIGEIGAEVSSEARDSGLGGDINHGLGMSQAEGNNATGLSRGRSELTEECGVD